MIYFVFFMVLVVFSGRILSWFWVFCEFLGVKFPETTVLGVGIRQKFNDFV